MVETGGLRQSGDNEKRIKLLIVDDEVDYLTVLARRLELRGFVVATASTGEEARTLAREEEFDLALVDLVMPGISGQTLLEELKREHQLIEVIVITGHSSPESVKACSDAGAFSYLQKPIEHDELAMTLKNAYAARMEKQIVADEAVLKAIVDAAVDSCPYGILSRLRKLDDEVK